MSLMQSLRTLSISGLASSDALAPLRERWLALDPRARPVIMWAAVALVIGIFWAYVYQPMQQSRTQNAARVATLKVALANMQNDAREIASLNSVAAASTSTPNTPSPRTVDSAALTAAFGAAFTVRADTGGQFRVESSRVRYADFVSRLDAAARQFRLNTASLTLSRLHAESDEVSVTLTLQPTAR
jgi:type II secretory pathway component PulM